VSGLNGCNEQEDPTIPLDVWFPTHQVEPSWGPTGLIAYRDEGVVQVLGEGLYRTDPELAGIWVIDPTDGSRQRILGLGRTPSWAPDGSRLAFGAGGQIFVVDADGSNLSGLMDRGSSFFPAWGPVGDLIAFDSNMDHPQGGHVIWTMHADGSGKKDISQRGVGEWREPSWSSDGTRVLHVRYGAGWPGREIFTMGTDGEDPLRLTTDRYDQGDPQYSPDGEHIAYTSYQGGLPQIWILDVLTGSSTQLTSWEWGGSDPSWSPDGTEIVFVTENWGKNLPEVGVLWIIDFATGAPRQLTQRWIDQPESTWAVQVR
jgi:TolB protein